MQKALTVGGGTPPTPSPPPLARSLARYFYPPPPLNLNPGYATGNVPIEKQKKALQ